jgi:ABC-type lipoprotein export system ATPase subunit
MATDTLTLGTATIGLTMNAPVALSIEDRRRHLHIIGKTGTGKSTLL